MDGLDPTTADPSPYLGSLAADPQHTNHPDTPTSFADIFAQTAPPASPTQTAKTHQPQPQPNPTQTLFGREPNDPADISPNDIHQNQIGDCYLDSTMGEIAQQDPRAIRGMIHDNNNGTYNVTLHQQNNGLHNLWGAFGNDYKDQTITVRPNNMAGAINSQTPDPVQVHGKHEMWPQVIEQAYAQQQGGYQNIGHGDWPSKAMQSLTGHDAAETPASKYSFNQLQSDSAAGKLVVLNTNNIAPNNNPLGLVGPHAYMVTGTTNTKQGQFVTLQNPWGQGTSGGTPATLTVPYARLQPYLTTASVGTTH